MLKHNSAALKLCYAFRSQRYCRGLATASTGLSDFSHAIIGGGVVGLSIAFELSKVVGNRVLLIEKNVATGLETSSRNSEVIHAGLYYPLDSLKTKLCLEGNSIIYNDLIPSRSGVEWSKCGKWIVAQTDAEAEYTESLFEKASKDLGLPVELIPAHKTKEIERYIEVGKVALSSPTSGIISSHSLMQYLATNIDNNGVEVAIGTELIDMEFGRGLGYNLLCKSTVNNSDETVEICVDNVVNASGLHAHEVANMLLPEDRQVNQYFGKGNYYSLAGSSFPPVGRLIYPVPPQNAQSLGTHLTIDLNGQIRFGPDLEYVTSPADYDVNCSNIESAFLAISTYFPHIKLEDLQPAYSGIRPKLGNSDDKQFKDFYIREEDGFPGFVNLLGIESPGLTSSLAIGKYVRNLYHC
ncbi:LANO_0G08966g1_1 [Lachancea nothofagi CBS 11611]|uniref:L-2-hydroxyglutarate dehydrogenase, mitochondrial n=1 Tax=Lachancea nothofagi CBS 11611 TaxID=1266666 RepID=A0A1G4KIL1_9SACH|nr:LANO_0G08966g1_1 [Lachancea nothofagi CBS 11611]